MSHAQGPGWEAVPGEAGGMRVRWAESGADGFGGELGCRTQGSRGPAAALHSKKAFAHLVRRPRRRDECAPARGAIEVGGDMAGMDSALARIRGRPFAAEKGRYALGDGERVYESNVDRDKETKGPGDTVVG